MDNINKLYQQTIMDYAKRNDVKGEIENPNYALRGHNPSCGDDITLLIKLENDKIVDMKYIGSSCAISSASTSMLIENVIGKNKDEVQNILNSFFSMMRSEEYDETILNDASVLEFVKDMPARIKCATLSWHSLKSIIGEGNDGIREIKGNN